MSDQAQELRNLMLLAARQTRSRPHIPPSLLAVVGGKGGVGTTSVAIQLAAALTRLGQRVVLVDADVRCGDVAALCGIVETVALRDVCESRVALLDALQPGPEGTLVLPARWGDHAPREFPREVWDRVFHGLATLSEGTDWIVVDAGLGDADRFRALWQGSQELLLVSSPDVIAVMDSYAVVKSLVRGGHRLRLRPLINLSSDEEQSRELLRRLAQACRRFLGHPLLPGLSLPTDPAMWRGLAEARRLPRPADASPFAQAVQQLARALLRSRDPTEAGPPQALGVLSKTQL